VLYNVNLPCVFQENDTAHIGSLVSKVLKTTSTLLYFGIMRHLIKSSFQDIMCATFGSYKTTQFVCETLCPFYTTAALKHIVTKNVEQIV
jgi:hypothetical protein